MYYPYRAENSRRHASGTPPVKTLKIKRPFTLPKLPLEPWCIIRKSVSLQTDLYGNIIFFGWSYGNGHMFAQLINVKRFSQLMSNMKYTFCVIHRIMSAQDGIMMGNQGTRFQGNLWPQAKYLVYMMHLQWNIKKYEVKVKWSDSQSISYKKRQHQQIIVI